MPYWVILYFSILEYSFIAASCYYVIFSFSPGIKLGVGHTVWLLLPNLEEAVTPPSWSRDRAIQQFQWKHSVCTENKYLPKYIFSLLDYSKSKRILQASPCTITVAWGFFFHIEAAKLANQVCSANGFTSMPPHFPRPSWQFYSLMYSTCWQCSWFCLQRGPIRECTE